MKPWFRFYHEALDDPKVQRLPAPLFRSWVNLLCLASRYEGSLPCLEDCAFSLRMSVEEMHETLTLLCERGLIDADGPEDLHPHNWDARQPASDGDSTGAARQARYRASRSAPSPVTSPDEDSVTESDSNASRNALRDGASDALRNPARPDVDQTETRQDQTQSALRAPRMHAREAPKPVPKPNRGKLVIDAIRAELGDVAVDGGGRNAAAVRDCTAPPEEIAAAYVAAYRGDWPPGDSWLRNNLSLHLVCSRIDSYGAWLAGGGNGRVHETGRQRSVQGVPQRAARTPSAEDQAAERAEREYREQLMARWSPSPTDGGVRGVQPDALPAPGPAALQHVP